MRPSSCLAALCVAFAALSGAQAQTVDDPRSSGSYGNSGDGAGSRSGPMLGSGGFGSSQSGLPQTPTITNTNNGLNSGPTATRRADGTSAYPPRRDLPPPRPSEFQKFVETATGRLLPVFGSRFFSEAAEPSFGSLDNVPVSADYVVAPGDEVLVRAWGSIDVDYRATVDRNGQVSLPRVGTFNVAGIKAADLQRELQAQIGKLFTNFNLNVTLGQLRGVRVFVVGPAQRPGVYTLPSQSTVLSAVVAAGGPSANGSMRKLTLRRDGKTISELDIYDFLVQGDKSKDLQLAAGDVVVFGPVGPRVALNGATDSPAIYELKSASEPVSSVLKYAGGAPVLANPNLAQLERIDPAQPRASRFVEEFKLDTAGVAKPLRDGDVLTLLAISPQFANAVTLKGAVAQPLRYAYKPGMKISDLIPDREALISPDFYRRKNLLVQVMPLEDEQDGRNRYGQRRYDANGQPIPGSTRGSATGGTTNGDSGTIGTVGANGRGTRGGGYVDPNDIDRNAQGNRAGTGAYRDDASDPNRPASPASSQRNTRNLASLFDELNWDYAVIERLDTQTLQTQLIPFNLGGAVIRHNPNDDIVLQPGDVVTVFSQRDIRVPVARQTRLVSLEGEVGAPGVYQVLPGETLKGLIARAGGFTPQAYVYGLEFTREEARQRQRQNLNEAAGRLESLAATQAAREAANRREDNQSAAVSSAATQAQLARISRIQPNGRIALELQPGSAGLDNLPDVPLEHADRILVPSRPGFVTVAGAVANSNAFLWKDGRTVGDYVRMAGLDEAANAGQIFVLRADGTVISAGDNRGFFGFGGIDKQALQPGDAVFVPNQFDFETWGRALVRNLKDFGQIFYQFGLGAAAITTLRNN